MSEQIRVTFMTTPTLRAGSRTVINSELALGVTELCRQGHISVRGVFQPPTSEHISVKAKLPWVVAQRLAEYLSWPHNPKRGRTDGGWPFAAFVNTGAPLDTFIDDEAKRYAYDVALHAPKTEILDAGQLGVIGCRPINSDKPYTIAAAIIGLNEGYCLTGADGEISLADYPSTLANVQAYQAVIEPGINRRRLEAALFAGPLAI